MFITLFLTFTIIVLIMALVFNQSNYWLRTVNGNELRVKKGFEDQLLALMKDEYVKEVIFVTPPEYGNEYIVMIPSMLK
jgi:hypothetical protein